MTSSLADLAGGDDQGYQPSTVDSEWTLRDAIRTGHSGLEVCRRAGFTLCGSLFDDVGVFGEIVWCLVVNCTTETSGHQVPRVDN